MKNLKQIEVGFAIVVFAFGIALITYFFQPPSSESGLKRGSYVIS